MVLAGTASAGRFLAHKTLHQKIAFLRHAVRHDRHMIKVTTARLRIRRLVADGAATFSPRYEAAKLHRTRAALAWHRHMLVRYLAVVARRRSAARPSLGRLRAYAGCLAPIIDIEDPEWSATRANPTSGAYGLPQALPGSKMASAGRDWATNPYTQIRWMRGYVNGRYGSCAGAMAHENAYGWY
jgi:hypothetical protein